MLIKYYFCCKKHHSNLGWARFILCGLCSINLNDRKVDFGNSIGCSDIENQRDRWSERNKRNITWLSRLDLEWSHGYEKALLKKGAMFALNCLKNQSCDNFGGVFSLRFVTVDEKSQRIGDGPAVGIVGFSLRIGTD